MKFLDAENVQRALPMADAVEAMKGALKALSAGNVNVPARVHVAVPDANGDALFMPAYSAAEARMSLKVVTMFEDNHAKSLPFIQAVVLLLDATNGTTLAIMDGSSLTAIRTGAASGAATDVLARADASVIAVFGAGVQARTQLEAVCSVRQVTAVRVVDVDAQRAAEFASDMQARLDVGVVVSNTSAEALAGADIVCTATTSPEPVFNDSEIEPGTHINAIGSYKPNVREVPGQTVARARVFVDQLEAAWDEAGDLIIAAEEGMIDKAHVQCELGAVIAGKCAGRETDKQITFFKSVGIAVQDLAAASRVLATAEKEGLGVDLAL